MLHLKIKSSNIILDIVIYRYGISGIFVNSFPKRLVRGKNNMIKGRDDNFFFYTYTHNHIE